MLITVIIKNLFSKTVEQETVKLNGLELVISPCCRRGTECQNISLSPVISNLFVSPVSVSHDKKQNQ